ncbi:ERAD-associated protein [Rhizoclosmatium sp. JEL0117]|nr:ERAD-associated protein [Rhizoclosmatium sp. JEL0117]
MALLRIRIIVLVLVLVLSVSVVHSQESVELERESDGQVLFRFGHLLLRQITHPNHLQRPPQQQNSANDAAANLLSLVFRVAGFDVDADSDAEKDSAKQEKLSQADALDQLEKNLVVARFKPPPNSNKDIVREKAVLALDAAANEFDNQDAQLLLADMFLHSRFLHPRNVSRAIEYYSLLSTNHANPLAQRTLGLMYATGLGFKRDYAKALLYLSFAALQNDVIAHQTLAYWHSIGIATPKSCDDAVYHYKAVANKAIEMWKTGPPGGLTLPPTKIRLPESLGGIYGPGASGPGAPSKALPQSHEHQKSVRDIFEISAQEGDHSVQLELGNIYYTGTRHTKPNHKKALKYFLSAAKAYPGKKPVGEMSPTLKHKVAIASMAAGYLGTMYWRGEGVSPDPETARQWFERGEELGNGMSLNGLGMMVLEGVAGFEKDKSKALQYFTNAIQKDYPEAYVSLAELTLQIGSPDALASSLKFFSQAAQKPPASPLTLYRLAEFHEKGLGGTPKNCATALGFYKSLVEKADWHDKSLLRAFEHTERDTPADWESAFILYLFAAERGIEVAQTNAAWMIDSGYVGGVTLNTETVGDGPAAGEVKEKDPSDPIVGGALEVHANDLYEVALVLWNRAANQGNVDARVKMGDYHYYGIGLKAFEAMEAEAIKVAGEEEVKKEEENGGKAAYDLTGFAGSLKKLAMPYLSKQNAVLSEPRFDKAALYYQVAADEASALAQWNIGYMHENGLGVAKDYPLAKRMYDMSLATNPEAYLAVHLALTQLSIKTFFAKTSAFAAQYLSREYYKKLLKKYNLIEEFEQFEKVGDEHIKGALPKSVDEHLVSVGGKGAVGGSKMTGGSEHDLFGEVAGDAVVVTVLSVIIGALFLWRRIMPVPVVRPVPVVPVVAAAPETVSGGSSGSADRVVSSRSTSRSVSPARNETSNGNEGILRDEGIAGAGSSTN